MKCSRCGTKLEVLFEDDVRDDGTPFTEKAVDPCPKCCPARKPIRWHPAREKPDTQYRFWVITLYGEVYFRASYVDPRFHVAWAYESDIVDLKALAADARAAMEGEG